MEINKYVFGCVCIGSLVGLQLGAWYFGFDGQITVLCTTAIGSIIAFIIGKSLGVSHT
jgi:hypothetical protein